ncbi:MAG: hypothetical protein QW117_03375 [Candidatus Pacearchaeota archaeon]
MEKIIIFDSSVIINFALNGILNILENLKKIFPGKFIITKEVKKEIIDTPLNNKKYELEALQINKLFNNKILELPETINIKSEEITKESKKVLNLINNSFYIKNKQIHIIDEGEASCIALSFLCENKGIKSIIAIDERTTRLLCENPFNLKEILEKKLHTEITLKKNLDFLKWIKCVRSSELVFFAYKKNIVDIESNNVLDALLYAVKFKGCSISEQEISEMKKISKTI